MQTEPDLTLKRIDQAMERQSWREAWVLLEEANPDYSSGDRHLGARRQDYIMLAAHCLRHRGQLNKSEELYMLLSQEIPLNDPRLTEALMGRADILHMHGELGEAMQLLRAASFVPSQSPDQRVRLQTLTAHVLSHTDTQSAISLFRDLIAKDLPVSDSVKANLHFWYGDALLTGGLFPESQDQLGAARELAQQGGCAVTLADAMRRMPLVSALNGESSETLSQLSDIVNARNLYRTAGDRGEAFLYTESGEVHRWLGKLREAESEFMRGLWASREVKDLNRVGHNQLGMFEVSRQALRPKPDLLDEAEHAYAKAKSDWGRLHVLISRALIDRTNRLEIIDRAKQLIAESEFSEFQAESNLLAWMRSAPETEIEQEPHIMNYP